MSAVAFLENYSWVSSLSSNFREWFLIIGLLLLTFTYWVKIKRKYFVGFVITTILSNLSALYPQWRTVFLTDKLPVENSSNISILYANLYSANDSKHILINHLKQESPDLVFLVEFNSSWATEINKLQKIYLYSKAIIREGNFGMAILSKTPMEVNNILVEKGNMIPALFLKMSSSIGRLNLVLLHAHPPFGSYGTALRNQYLDSLSHRIRNLEFPTLVCGDFNTTPWTSVFKKFLRHSKLKPYNKKLAPNTWPTNSLLPGLPIDHCLSKGLNISNYKKGNYIGSDHLPITLKISKIKRAVASDH